MGQERDSMGKRLRLTGARFEGGRLPIDSLVELQKYQEVLRIAARAEWHRRHYDEELPVDFDDSVSLTIERVDEGSADIFMAFEQHAMYQQYQIDAQHAVDRIISAAYSDDSLPPIHEARSGVEDHELLQVVSHLGATLSDGQSLEYYTDVPGSPPISITLESRERAIGNLFSAEDFFLAADFSSTSNGLQNSDTSLVGRITILDANKQKFTMELSDGRKVHGWYRGRPHLLEDFRAVLNSTQEGPLTRISGLLQFKDNKPFRFRDVRSLERVEFDDTEWGERLASLASLLPGWADGEGEPISFTALDAAQVLLRAVEDANIRRPGLFPTEEGGVLIEWANEKQVRSIEVTADGDFELFFLRSDQNEGEHSEVRDLSKAIAFVKVESE